MGEDLLETMVVLPHLYHIKLGDAVLLHTHGHGDAVLLDEHGEAWRRGIREEIDKGTGEGGIEGKGGGEREEETRDAPIRDLSNHQLKSTLMAPVEVKENVKKKQKKNWVMGAAY